VETEATVATGAMVETAVMAVAIEAMVVGREAMAEVTVHTVVVVEDTPTGVEDTPAVAAGTGITGEGSLTVGMVVQKERLFWSCNREPLKYGKYYFWF